MQDMSCNSHSSTPSVKHLDGEYRRRYELYTTPSKVYDSRIINWRDIPWDEVTGLEASVEGHHYVVEPGEGFQGFIRWRWGGFHFNGKIKINVWCVGWHDGKTCFMQEIEFKDGSMKRAEYPFEEFKKHLVRT